MDWIDQQKDGQLASTALENLKEMESLAAVQESSKNTSLLSNPGANQPPLGISGQSSSSSLLALNLNSEQRQKSTSTNAYEESFRKGVAAVMEPAHTAALSGTMPALHSTKRMAMERPLTPSVPEPGVENLEPHVLLLQRLLRGRGEQNRFFEGKERRRDLIRELQLQERKKDQGEEERRESSIRDSTLDSIAGALVSTLLSESVVEEGAVEKHQ